MSLRNLRQSQPVGVSRHPHPSLMRKSSSSSSFTGGVGKRTANPTAPNTATLQTFPKVDPWMCDLSCDSSTFIVIHVHDENNKISKDFYCNRTVLLREMRYFRSYVSEHGADKDEYDISVHCDSVVFLWLVEYVHASLRNTTPPQMDNIMAVSALISADFLQMTSVVPEILSYIHHHASEIVRLPISLDCIRRPLLERLSTYFTNETLLHLKDRKDKLSTPIHLYRLKAMLSGENTLFRCKYCGKLYTSKAPAVTCLGAPQEVDHRGVLQGLHDPDPTWQLSTYLLHLHRIGVSWSQIFWRLWALVKYDECSMCKTPISYAQVHGCTNSCSSANQNELGPGVSTHHFKGSTQVEKDFLRLVLEKHADTQIPLHRDIINSSIHNTDVVPLSPGEIALHATMASSSSSMTTPRKQQQTVTTPYKAPRIDLIREMDGRRSKDLMKLLQSARQDAVDTFLTSAPTSAPFGPPNQLGGNTPVKATTQQPGTGGGNGSQQQGSATITSPSCNTRGRQTLARRGSASGTK